jgi:hypothetical protein
VNAYVRRSADIEGDFVVFVLGMHVNRWTDVQAWLPVVRAMPRMLAELAGQPDLGLLQAHSGWLFGGPAVVQYWRSYEQLEAYARSTGAAHLPAWRAFNRTVRTHPDSVGIFHETYRVSAGSWETIYGAMPEVGLLAASRAVDLSSGSTSATRLSEGVRP